MKLSETIVGLFWLVCVCAMSVSAQVRADQNAPDLPGLFADLQQAKNQLEASEIEAQIWQRWLEAPDEQSEQLMSEIALAMAGSDLKVALQLCDELIESHPDYAEAWNKRATLNYLLGNNAESVADIRETVALEPRHFGAISGLGLIFLRAQNFDAALEAFEQVLAISPASESAKRSVDRLRRELQRKREEEQGSDI